MMRIAVFGIGNIGLPLSCVFASIGQVIAADIDKKKIEMINKGISYLPNEERVPELLKKYVSEKKIEGTTDLDYAAKNSDVKIIIVPLLLTKGNQPDFSIINDVCEVIGGNLKKDDLVIVSTTMPLGATRNVVGKILEGKSGMKIGKDFYLAYAPEKTMNPKVVEDTTERWHQIIGGLDKKSAEKAAEIYRKFNKRGVIILEKSETAEMVKLLDGIYRYTNIALANEVAFLCEKFGVDFIEVMKSFNLVAYYSLHKATIGVGGHCIPVYPHFVLNQIDEYDLIRPSIKINKKMPERAIEIIEKKCGPLDKKKIAILGLSYRGDIKEDRLSPTYDVINLLKAKNSDVFINDPFFTRDELENKTKVKFIDINDINSMDGIIVATDHSEFAKINFGGSVKFVFDGKSFLSPEKIKNAGIKYLAIGRTSF